MQDGARVANVNLMKGLTSLGVKIDLVAVADEGENCDIEELKRVCGVSDCFVLRRESNGGRFGAAGVLRVLKSFLAKPWLAVTLMPFASSALRREITALLAKGPGGGRTWSALVYDGLHTAAHASVAGAYSRPPASPRVIYRAHNVEYEIWNRKMVQTGFLPFKLFLKFQTYLMKRFELSLVEKADAVMTVSEVDLEMFRKQCPSIRGSSVPIGYDFGTFAPAPENAERCVFLARLDWPPNRDGLMWVLDKVWPEVHRKRPKLELWIAGSGNSDWLRARLPIAGVKFLGRVESVEAVYRDCYLSLVPVFYGSGTRVKAIEASRYGRACLSTAVGIEGLGLVPGKTYFQAETAEEWISILERTDAKHIAEVGREAHEFLKTSFHLPVAARKFLDGLKS